MPHKRAKAVGKLLFFDNKTTPRSIDRFGFIFYHVPPHVLGPFRGVGAIMCFRGGMLNPNRSNDRLGLKRDKSRSYAC